MAIKYGRKAHRRTNVIYTFVTIVLLCFVFLAMVSYFYSSADSQAYENLHIQTKQIKDDMQLQLFSDRENLATMANFAAKLYSDGESYNIMLDSFKPIGLIKNIGILNPDNTFVTKVGAIDLKGRISFDEEILKGEYISGRMNDLTTDNHEIIRSAVPIKVDGNTVGILYGVIGLDVLSAKYNNMAKELDAQLFVYDTDSGNLVIDTLNETLGNISFLKNRKYNEGYSYQKMIDSDKGFTSFVSAYTGEDLYVHFSMLENLNWKIVLARYESQVFAETHLISNILFITFSVMVFIMALYVLIIISNERRRYKAMEYASDVRRLLLGINQQNDNIFTSLKNICLFSSSRSSFIFDNDGKDYNYVLPALEKNLLISEDREYFKKELLRYAAEFHNINNNTVNLMCIIPNAHLEKTNRKFYLFLKEHVVKKVTFATVIDENNYITILGVVNPAKSKGAKILVGEVAVCFSIALYNKMHLNKTELVAITDSLTGVLNRVAYKKDVIKYDEDKPEKFSCIYIDVNELHFKNNKYGHAAGDQMLLFIANTLKDIFYGHKVYRLGGDEFLVFTSGVEQEIISKGITMLIDQLTPMDYHVAIGMSYRSHNTNTEELVREAEIRMYEAKAQYYQHKEHQSIAKAEDKNYVQIKTGISEIDSMISILKEHYNGIYRVSLDTDKARRILMPAYLGYNEDEEHFSSLFSKYIYETVNVDFHRSVTSFLNYDAIKSQLMDGKIPRITYKKVNGETVILSIYNLCEDMSNFNNTLWVFAKD